MNRLYIFIVNFLLILSTLSYGQNEYTFLVPDSVISLSSYQEISYDGRVFGMPIWDELPDSAIIQTKDEWLENRSGDQNEFGVNRAAWHVQTPSMLFIPAAKDTLHPVVVIFPGGGFNRVVIDKEGIDVAQRLNQYGVSAVVVKYRTHSSINWSHVADSLFNAIYADALQAMKLVKENAAQYNFDTTKIGTMGFSAGGALAAKLLVYANSEISVSDPDFSCLTYPVLYDTIRQKVSQNTPPTFLVSTKDDGVSYPYTQEFYDSLKAKGVESEFQLFESGGHGYGLGVNGGDVAQWPGLFIDWLEKNDILITAIENKINPNWKKPNKFILYDCYPNPFNPQTTIKYYLNKSQGVSVKIFDISGKEIDTIFDGYQLSGEHHFVWQAKDKSSGVYILKIYTGDKISSQKLILIK